MKVLVTGGAGFIGSTIASFLLDRGTEVVVLDDLSTGRREFVADRTLYEGDIADAALVAGIFVEHPDINAVVHCAAKIVVPESVADPLGYYAANVAKTVSLLRSVVAAGCTRLVFSSTAAVYAGDNAGEVDEGSACSLTSPYASSKWMIERILQDTVHAHDLRAVSFRYFNPIGSDPQFRTGLQLPEPTHALGMLMRAHETRTPFTLTGTDWATRDGTGVRDYVHVWDLAEAHVRALDAFDDVVAEQPYDVINLGTGTGVTVRELVAAYREVTGNEIEVLDGIARPGDSIGCYCSTGKARRLLGWQPTHSLQEGIAASVAWRSRWLARL